MGKLRIPEPNVIKHADVCRDGGSYSIGFETINEVYFSIEIPVKLDEVNSRIGYYEPRICSYNPKEEIAQLSWHKSKLFSEKLVTCKLLSSVNKQRLSEALKLLCLSGKLN